MKLVRILLPLLLTAATPLGLMALDNNEEQYLNAYGWIVVRQSGVTELGLSNEECEALFAGMKKAMDGEELEFDLQKINPKMQAYLQKKATTHVRMREQELSGVANKNKEDANNFFADLAKNPAVKKSPTGLYYEIQAEGVNPKPKVEDAVTIHYTGKLINGNVFDSSLKRGEPATFNLDRVIEGFREGLQLVGKGGKVKLYIPSNLGYGNSDIPGIPPGSTLIFDIEVLDVVANKPAL